jgi:UDP-glucuronate 4-epimerase
LALALRERGERLVLLDNFNNYYDPAIKRRNVNPFLNDPLVTVIEGDVRDAEQVKRIVSDHKITRIAHLAAMAGVRTSIEESPLYFEVNLMGTIHLLEAARASGVQQFVLASTSSVYGETTRVPFVEEDAADRPLASYPASKRGAEIAAYSYHHLFGLNVTCVRFFNVYGPAGRPDMMPLKVIRAACEDTPITLFEGGKLSRDWTYIDDIIGGVVAALDRPLGYEIINLGCGAPISMLDFVEVIEELSGKSIQRVIQPAPPSDPPITYCDNSRARRLLGFDPKVNVAEGLARTWTWYVSHLESVR